MSMDKFVNPLFDEMSRRFAEGAIELTNSNTSAADYIIFGMAQEGVDDSEQPYIMAIGLDELCTNGNFDPDIWEDLIDDTFDNHVKRPWFMAVGVPVSSMVDGEKNTHFPYITMERMVIRYMIFEMQEGVLGTKRIVSEPSPLPRPSALTNVLDSFGTVLRKHVVHQG